MKVLVLNGSPKKDKSDTMHITRAFLKGMNEVEKNTVEIIDVIEKNINYCKGCFTCKKNGGTCIYNDDMKEILKKILSVDILIFNFPLYCFGMPAPLKALIDRTLPFSSMMMRKINDKYEHIEQADFKHLKYVMICGCGFPNSKHNFEPAIEQFKLCFPNNHTIITISESPMFNVIEASSITKPRLDLVYLAGKEYAEKGFINNELLVKIESPMIDEDLYAKIANGEM